MRPSKLIMNGKLLREVGMYVRRYLLNTGFRGKLRTYVSECITQAGGGRKALEAYFFLTANGMSYNGNVCTVHIYMCVLIQYVVMTLDNCRSRNSEEKKRKKKKERKKGSLSSSSSDIPEHIIIIPICMSTRQLPLLPNVPAPSEECMYM